MGKIAYASVLREDLTQERYAPFVRIATALLFAVFGGFAPGPGVIEELTERSLSQRL